LTDNSLQPADKDQQEMRAVAEKPHNAVVTKIRHVSKFTAASRGPPCDSTASCITRLNITVCSWGKSVFSVHRVVLVYVGLSEAGMQQDGVIKL